MKESSMVKKIVVGVDGSAVSQRALEWAVDEARAHRATLEVVYAYPNSQSVLPYSVEETTQRMESERMHAAGQQLIDRMIDQIGVADGVDMTGVVVQGPAANALVERSADADLLVVGNRGHGGFTGLVMGSVSHQCSLHARCPVVIIRDRD
jgi:nucleotide-binding universal stress UspA family protein